MPDSSLTVQVPGKLMIAGEFAVLEKYQKLVVTAVNRFVFATICEGRENRLSLESFDLNDMEWQYESNTVHIKTNDKRVQFVEEAMTTVYRYLGENHLTPSPFHLAIRSELDDVSGRKYGLGSSAAVVTSVVAAMLHQFLPEKPSDSLIFKLAAIAHVKTQGSGSGADVAASSYGGWLEYASFQADWLKEAYLTADSITELVNTDWRYFSADPLKLPDHIYMCIGWTGSPASTPKLVEKISALNKTDSTLYQQFLTNSEEAVHTFLNGMRYENSSLIFEGIRKNRHALAEVGKNAGAEIETPLLKTLCDLAEEHGGAGKPSGAGGGDCGIAFLPSKEQAEHLMEAWKEAGIQTLDIMSNEAGAIVI
ncbi:phosphomevalonate kinase [Lentibacillus halodurans]|uniref:phosphomevalonate kinase n=1 Tax=Lentibacillus halodurans TaxID=237679 RepID=A0A1I0Y5F2_9BACI|nr:phosphomevalonate kinase [Lentibacillus halodurans]SFB08452.1 phosphomevalonate kinase [Lentibacillus halodurans]